VAPAVIPKELTPHRRLNQWIQEIALLCKPKEIVLCDGSPEEFRRVADKMVSTGTLTPLNPEKRPRSFWCHTHPDDVARVEENTFICSASRDDAGPTNNWCEPAQMRERLRGLFNGCMQGRTMYVIPYCMGPLTSLYARFGVEITDSPYVVLSMHLMARVGAPALRQAGQGPFIPGVHSVGVPLKEGEADRPWPCNPENRWIVHFPESREIWSFGSGYGGNALLGKKCFALRIASVLGREEGWLAEHMLILGITNPAGEKKYIAAAFPSSCGKTNLAMLTPSIPGWKIETVGDDIAWIHRGADGRLYAINPEAGFFGVAPGTSMRTNPNALRSLQHDALFTNVALTQDRDVWWEGLTPTPPKGLTSWLGAPYDAGARSPAAHPNARFTVRAKQCPTYDPEAENPKGVPLSAILFGGRRNGTIPLVAEAFSWAHGVFFGAAVSSETTAAAKGEVGKVRHDPFAMLPFCGYHMGDYFSHWLQMGQFAPDKLPRVYMVNWFRRDAQGRYLWPGYGDNVRVLKWVFERADQTAPAVETPIGFMPQHLDLEGLSLTPTDYTGLFHVDRADWEKEIVELREYFQRFQPRLPKALLQELDALETRLALYSSRGSTS
jgi:phosphoenolpyruvate carboxykinase (GTP)